MLSDRRRILARCLVFLAQLAALAIVAGPHTSATGFPLDDAWIHALATRTFVTEGTLGIVPGTHGSGVTSTLWVLLMSPSALLGVAPPAFALVVNGLLLLLGGQVFLSLLLGDGIDVHRATACAAVFGCAPNFVWFAASGMEATLSCFLALVSIATWFSPSLRTRVWSGACLGLLAITRPEGLALLPLLLASKRPGSRSEWLSLGLAPLSAGLHGFLNYWQTGQFSPATLEGRRWMWLAPLDGVSQPARVQLLLEAWLDRLGEYTLGYSGYYAPWACVGLALWGVLAVRRNEASRVLVLWMLIHWGVYAITLPTLGHGGRYQPLIPAAFSWLVLAGALRIGDDLGCLVKPAHLKAAGICFGVGLGALWALGPGRALLHWRDAQRDAVRHVNDTEVAMGKAVKALPAGAKIASFDIGGIGYFSERPIFELGGLADQSIVPLLWSGQVPGYLRRHRIDHLILPLGLAGESAPEPWNFGYRLGVFQSEDLRLKPDLTLESSLDRWRRGLRATLHCSPRQTLYSVSFSEAP